MKKTISILVFIFCSVMAHAQFIDPPSISRLHGVYARWQNVNSNDWFADTVKLNFADTSMFCFNHNQFVLGSQWGVPTRSLAKRIYHRFYNEKWENGYNVQSDTASVHIPRNSGKHFFSSNNIDMLGYNWSVAHRWSPIAPLPAIIDNNYIFQINYNDTTGMPFGFWYKQGGTVQGQNYKLTVDSAIGYGSAGRLILAQPINNTNKNGGIPFYSNNDNNSHKDAKAWNGRHWYFSITLNRADALYNDSTGTNDTVLIVKIPIHYTQQLPNSIVLQRYRALRFDSILRVGTQTANIPYMQRGGYMDTKLVYSPQKDSQLVIRRSMLPKYSDTSQVTLSGYFFCPVPVDGIGNPVNPFFPNGAPVGSIDSLNVEIRYKGKCNITINNCMILSQMARWVFRGDRDTVIAGMVTAHDIRPYLRIRDTCPNLRFWRFYGLDETNYPHYLYHRYLSKLFEKNFTTEGPAEYLYQYMVPQKDYWRGTITSHIRQYKPFLGRFVYNESDSIRLGMLGGIFRPYISPSAPLEYLGHNYDLRADGRYISGVLDARSNSHHELDILDGLARELYNTPQTVYSPSPFFYNVHMMQQWRVKKFGNTHKPYLYAEYNCQQTTEEYRAVIWTGLGHGAKGFMYDRFPAGSLLYVKSDSLHADYYNPSINYIDNGLSGYQINVPDSWIRSENPADGDRSIYSNGMGSDFLYNNHPTKLDSYIDTNITNAYFYVKPGRMYIGLRSIRHEIRKVHDYLHQIGDTLIKLDLFATYNKGRYIFKSAASGNPSDFDTYISTDSTKLTTQSFNDTIPDSWANTNVDITIHKHKTIPMTQEFYVTVLNRRTSPLLELPASRRPNFAYPFMDSLTFFSGYEFDSLTTDFTNTLSSGDKDFWFGQRYKQGGSRLLKLPFRYYAPQTPYTLLQVTELGAQDQFLDSVYPYRNNVQLYQKVDTVIAQDGTLSLKLLAGEGKMFRVKVIPSDTSINGILAHSNQRKLISFPIPVYDSTLSKYVLSTDSVRYYLSYFRPVNDSNKRTVVCYRRSETAAFNTPSANVQWENEIVLSDSYIHPSRTIVNDTCAYPSVLVQYDTNSAQIYVFVVYGCMGYMPPPGTQERYQRIVQSYILPVDTGAIITSRVLVDNVYSHDLSEYGTPMIAGTERFRYGGVFYTWADKKQGIGVGWSPTGYPFMSASNYIRFHEDTSACPTVWKAQHPSLSTYMPLRHNGRDCALAWQENYSCSDNRTEIFTTRLKSTTVGMGDYIFHYLGADFENAGNYGYFNADSSIYCLSNNESPLKDTVRLGNTFVMPWRELSLRDTCSVVPLSAASRIRMDAFVWQQQRPTMMFSPPTYTRLLLGGLLHPDTLIGGTVTPIRTSVLTKTILSHFPLGDLYYPTISQGTANSATDSYSLNAAGCLNSSNTSLVINAIETNELFGGSFAPQYIHQELSHTPFAYVAPQKSIAGTTFGSYIHLAGMTFAHAPTNRWEHRRVYNHRPSHYAPTALPQILASARYFYKQGDDVITRSYLGWNDADGSVSVTLPEINSIPLQWNVRSDRRSPYMIPSDTLCTEWFRINDLTSMKQWIKTEGWDALQVYIQKKGEEPQRLPLSIRKSTDGRGTKHQTDFTNGENEEYRLLFSRGTETAYLERMIITEPDNDGLEKATVQTIDLQQLPKGKTELSIYPNPASDEITITWKGSKATVQLLDMKGNVLITHTIHGMLTLPTEELTNGLYMIRLQQGINSITKSFMVLK